MPSEPSVSSLSHTPPPSPDLRERQDDAGVDRHREGGVLVSGVGWGRSVGEGGEGEKGKGGDPHAKLHL